MVLWWPLLNPHLRNWVLVWIRYKIVKKNMHPFFLCYWNSWEFRLTSLMISHSPSSSNQPSPPWTNPSGSAKTRLPTRWYIICLLVGWKLAPPKIDCPWNFGEIPIGKSITGWWFFTTHLKKYARQLGSFPQIGVKIENIWNHHPDHF